jgi:uncharacterized protein (UPF0332 family)
MKQSYSDGLRNFIEKSGEEEWIKRMQKCAHRIFTSVCFRETAESTYQQTKSVLLPSIGFYYSLYHMGMAMLYMDFITPTDTLHEMRHATLRKLINNRLIQTKLIPANYLILLERLQEIREYANYNFGRSYTVQFKDEFKTTIPKLYKETGVAFDLSISYIEDVNNEVTNRLGLFSPMQIHIGDGIGDDLCQIYLSENDEERVLSYLIAKNLTT